MAKKEWNEDFPEDDPIYQFYLEILRIFIRDHPDLQPKGKAPAEEATVPETPKTPKPRKPRAKKSVPPTE